jgi:hypothetical protein
MRTTSTTVGSGSESPRRSGRTDSDEYFAEAVQSHFDTNLEGPVGGDGIHNQIDTRVELEDHDPIAYAMTDDLFGDAAPLDLCNG